MRWGATFNWISVAAFVAALVSQLLGWEAVRTGILIAWVVLVFLLVMSRGMRGTSILTYLSAAALLGAAISQLAGLPSVRGWFLLAWAALLLPVALGLFSHPMRTPSWGVFAGFWGVVGVLWLIVVQIAAVTGSLSGQAYRDWAAWPLALLGVWFLVASGLGFAARGRRPACAQRLDVDRRLERCGQGGGALRGGRLLSVGHRARLGLLADAGRHPPVPRPRDHTRRVVQRKR